MKKILITLLCAASVFAFTACGNKGGKKAASDEVDLDKVVENLENATFNGEKNTKEAAAFWFKKNYGLKVEDVTPDFPLSTDAPGNYDFLGEEQLSSYVTFKTSQEKLSNEEVDAYVTKAYEATKKVADDGKNVYGWRNSEKHAEEKPIDQILKDGWMDIFGFKVFSGTYAWSFVKGGIYYDVDVNFLEKKIEGSSDKVPYGARFTVGKGLQKSLDDTMEDLDKALSDPEVQKQMEKALKDLSK